MSKIFTSSTGRVKIEVSEDAMTAMMTISRSGSLIDEREILELIDRAGIKYGLEAAVRKMNTEGDQKDFDTAFPLAICKANNATKQVRYHFDNPISSATDIAPDMLDKLTCVSEGTVIADYSFNIFEGDGSIYNIFGEMQAEATVTDLSDICGNGVEYDPKTSRFLAKVSGYPYKNEAGQICLLDRIVFEEPLKHISLKTPIQVVVYADVCNCEINSASDIEIKGNLVSTKLYTEGKLVVGGQIIGCRESYLHVWGDTICHSVIDSRLICKGSLHFAGEIREAQIIAEKGVIGAETDSLIHSGSIQSSGSITAAVIGNTEEEPVEIEITISAYYKNYLMIRTKELIKMKQNPEISPEVIDETSTEIKHLESELDRDMSVFLKHERLEKLTIKASQRLHANTTLRILKHSYQIKHQEQDAEYREKD